MEQSSYVPSLMKTSTDVLNFLIKKINLIEISIQIDDNEPVALELNKKLTLTD
ncbi:19650_t:CDS:1, partial [Gigaspora margarita]